ncbi:UvrD-helicase domain-containing protein [Sphingobacterium humi]|uniref:DNA 3'-5' helicase n=1 Tax=Sphingobacterium humi TaxID=1796905 RepID=A0A6N8KZZ6_9SPHI|nr:UvrD-helicase domain-containing protein [Sphingobacterium humi]MVZ63050.1 AAA family ATPase [Sphingobacterium humi]
MSRKAPLKIVKASAGSGKTFSLTVHYLSLLLAKESNYREILAVTFTNKATAEMKERILTVLHGLAINDQSKGIDSYRQILLQQANQGDAIRLQEKARQVYRRILHDYSHFSVSTIDGFSQKVIRSFTYELNLDAAYAIEMNTNKVKKDLTVMLNQLLDEKPELLEWIIGYAEQKIANNENWNYRQQLMSLAGLIFSENFQEFDAYLLSADSNRVFNLLQQEISDKSKAFLEAFGQAITNFKETCRSLGLDEADMKGRSRNKLVSASKVDVNLAKASVTDLQKLFDRFLVLLDNDEAFTDQQKEVRYDLQIGLAPALQSLHELYILFPTFIAYQAVEGNLYFLRLLKEMSDLLSLWRKENASQLISDAQILLNKLGLDENNDPTFIWEKIGNRYNYFLFDEFQDTSRIQWKNYSPLLLNALANAEGKLNEHLVVGDVKQSIYRWRNGDWRILLQQVEQQVSQSFHLAPQQVEEFIEQGNLLTNYRSLPNLIKLNNYLFASIPPLLQEVLNEKVLENLNEEGRNWWSRTGNDQMLIKAYADSQQELPAHLQRADAPQGSIEINFLPVENGSWRSKKVEDASIEALCHKIGDWIASGRYKPAQIGILVRSNAQARLIIQELMDYKNKQHINFEVISGDALTLISNHAILLMIETMKALVYQSDKHVIQLANMAYLYQLVQGKSSFPQEYWLKFKNNNLEELAGLLPNALVETWESLQKMPLLQLSEKLIEIYGLQAAHAQHLPYLLAFKDLITQFSASGERGLIQFLDYWQEDGEKAVLPSNGKIDAIEVTTIHKSKGLAYDVVMLPFCSWNLDGQARSDFWIDVVDSPFSELGKIPVKYNKNLGNSIFYQQYFEEMLFNYMDALNTFYVANTRAKQHLYITAPQFKEAVDKKTGEILGYEIKNEYISDILWQVLDQATSQFKMENNQVVIQEIIDMSADTGLPSQEAAIALQHYPISNVLEKELDQTSSRSINNILLLEKAAQYGVLAHEIVSEASKEEDIDHQVESYIQLGILPVEDRDSLLQEIHEIWHHPQINQWLNGDFKIWNEASIITAEGETIRPDKVFTSAAETIVLDFKFTQGDYIGHKAQVDKYMKAIQNVGYQQVRGYLYYAKSKELVEVI